MLQNFASLGTGIIISFIFSWQLTLLVLGFVPFMIVGGFLQSRLMTGFATKDKQANEDAGKVCSSACSDARMLMFLLLLDCRRIDSEYSNSDPIDKRGVLLQGVLQAASTSLSVG